MITTTNIHKSFGSLEVLKGIEKADVDMLIIYNSGR